MKTKGHWVDVEVLAFNRDRSKILLKYGNGKEEWINAERIKKVVHQKVMAYITLPSIESRHFGMSCSGLCLEK